VFSNIKQHTLSKNLTGTLRGKNTGRRHEVGPVAGDPPVLFTQAGLKKNKRGENA